MPHNSEVELKYHTTKIVQAITLSKTVAVDRKG